MTLYNLSNITSANGPISFIAATNEAAGNILFNLFYVGFIVVALIALSDRPSKKTMPAIAFVSSLLGIFGFVLGWLNREVVIVVIVGLGVLTAMGLLNPYGEV